MDTTSESTARTEAGASPGSTADAGYAAGWRVTETSTEQQSRHPFSYVPEPCRVARLSHRHSGISVWASRYPDEDHWFADSLFSEGQPVFVHGHGTRDFARQALTPGLAGLLDAQEWDEATETRTGARTPAGATQ